MRLADRTSGHVLEAYDRGYLVRSLCAAGARSQVYSSVDNNHTRLPLCMFPISEANDDIDVDGLNASVKESYPKDSNVTCVLGEVVAFELIHVRAGTTRDTMSALNMKASMRRKSSQSLGSHLEFVGGC